MDRELLKEKFQCCRCGNCCKWHGYVNISSEEIDKIADFLNINIDEYMEKFIILRADRKGLSLIENSDGSCIYYDQKTGLCQIQLVKPKQCIDFPLNWHFSGFEEECAGAKRLLAKQF